MAQVIKRKGVNPWGQAFGTIGQGISGFTNGMMASKQLDLQQKMIDLYGKNGGGIMTPGVGSAQNPAAQPTAAAQPAQNQPTAQGGVDGQASGGTIPMPQNYDEMLRALMAYKNPFGSTYTG